MTAADKIRALDLQAGISRWQDADALSDALADVVEAAAAVRDAHTGTKRDDAIEDLEVALARLDDTLARGTA